MPLSMTDSACDLEIIEGLDFDIELPCEHSQHYLGKWGHKGPAYYYIHSAIPCGCEEEFPDHLLICKGGYEDTDAITCFVCFQVYPKEQVWTIISKVRK